jgi:hypothetical protein
VSARISTATVASTATNTNAAPTPMQHVATFKKKLEEEERRKKEEEERLRKEELARREKEEKQREFRETIRVYNGDLNDILVKVEAGDWQNWELGREKSLDLLKRAQTEADAEVRRITKLHNLSKVHEVERDMKRPQETLDMMNQVIADYTLLWEMVGRFDEFKSGIQKMNWSDLDGPQLEEDARNMLAKCKKLPKVQYYTHHAQHAHHTHYADHVL